jgi:acetoin utilization protein AcuB
MLVRDIMTDVVQFVDVTTKLRDVIVIFEAEDIRHLPVLRGDKLMGMISDRDVRGLGRYLRGFLEGSEEQSALDLPVSDFMQPDVVSLAPESSLVEAIDLLVHLRVGAAPVIELKTDELVGIVSYVDLLGAARRYLEPPAAGA